MTLIHADLRGIIDASWPARRSGHVARNPEPLNAVDAAREAADEAYEAAQAACDASDQAEDALDAALLEARLAGWPLYLLAEKSGLSMRDQRIRRLKNPPGAR